MVKSIDNPNNLPKLNSKSYKNATKMVRSNTFAVRRLKTLLVRVLTRIDKITIYLGDEELEAKELKTNISLLSNLIGVKKQISSEIKELEGNQENSKACISDLLQ